MVPPERGDIDGVAGFEIGDQCLCLGPRVARVTLAIGRERVDHAHRLAGKRLVERADIEVGGRAGRKQGKATAAERYDGEIVRQVEMGRSEEHTSELQSLMRISYAVFCLKK